jgi:hypothetical protein
MGQQGSSPNNFRYPAWENAFQIAVRENDLKRLLESIHAAEAAIFNRLQELAQDSDSPERKTERQAIADALGVLRVLKRDKLGFPDWEST